MLSYLTSGLITLFYATGIFWRSQLWLCCVQFVYSTLPGVLWTVLCLNTSVFDSRLGIESLFALIMRGKYSSYSVTTYMEGLYSWILIQCGVSTKHAQSTGEWIRICTLCIVFHSLLLVLSQGCCGTWNRVTGECSGQDVLGSLPICSLPVLIVDKLRNTPTCSLITCIWIFSLNEWRNSHYYYYYRCLWNEWNRSGQTCIKTKNCQKVHNQKVTSCIQEMPCSQRIEANT